MKKTLFVLCILLFAILLLPRRGGAETPTPEVPDGLEAQVLAAKQAEYPAWVGDEEKYLEGYETSSSELVAAPDTPDSVEDWTSIVLYKIANNNWEIYKFDKVDPNHAPVKTRLTDNLMSDIYPRFNRGATQIVFATNRDGNFEIYKMNDNGGAVTRLTTNGATDSQPYWSSDGSKIVFVSDRDGNAEIYIMNADGTGQARLTDHPASDVYPTISPDGSQIAWLRVSNSYGATVWVMNGDGSGQHAISPWYAYAQHLNWSPDGNWLLWDGDFTGDGWNEAIMIKPNGTGLQMLGLPGGYLYDRWVSGWMPNSQYILTNGVSYVVYDGQLYISQTEPGILSIDGNSSNGFSDARNYEMGYDAQKLDIGIPTSRVQPLPAYSRASGFSVNWTGSDTGLSGYWYMDVQSRVGESGNWTNWQTHVQSGSKIYSGNPGDTVYFRSQAVDLAENYEGWPIENGDTFTTLFTWLLQGKVVDNHGVSLPNPTVSIDPEAINSDLVGLSGIFIRYFADISPNITVSRPGYVAPPSTKLVGDEDKSEFWILSAGDNQIANGNFESTVSPWMKSGDLGSYVQEIQYHSGKGAVHLGQSSLIDNPVNLSNTSDVSETPQIVRDSNGNLHVVWSDFNEVSQHREIYYSYKSEGGNWSIPVSLTPDVIDAELPQLAIGTDNTLYLLWINYDGATQTGEINYSFKTSEGFWTQVQDLSGTISLVFFPFYPPKLSIDSLNGVHVVWKDVSGLRYIFQPAGESWSSPITITSSSNQFELVVDVNDQVNLLWIEDNQYLYHSYKLVDNTWSLPQLIMQADTFYGLEALADSDSGIHLTWFETTVPTTLYYSKSDSDGNWSSPIPISQSEHGSTMRGLAASADGYVHFIWTERYSVNNQWVGDTYYRVRYPDNSLSIIIPLFVDDSIEIDLGTGLWAEMGGALHLIWDADNPGISNADIYYSKISFLQNGLSALSQVVTIQPDMIHPTLSFSYLLDLPENWDNSPALETLINQSPVFSTHSEVVDWTHGWVDLSPWVGQTITITFQTHNSTDTGLSKGLTSAFLDDVSLSSWLTPVAYQIIPNSIPPYSSAVNITITGENFIATPTVKLGNTTLQNIQWIDEHTLQATIPANLPPGRYNLWVTNPGGQASVKVAAVIAGQEIFLPVITR